MTYEYLNGMGSDTFGPQPEFGQTNNRPPTGGSNGGSSGGSGGSTGGASGTQKGTTSKSFVKFNVGKNSGTNAGAGGGSTQTQGQPKLVFQAYVVEPTVPAGSVKTLPAERAELKVYYQKRFGSTAAWNTKLRVDPSFTYLEADLLAGYRNGSAVVVDMMRGPKDTSVTIADVSAFRMWWKKCHVATFTLFDIRQRDAMFVPRPLYQNYLRTFKRDNTCPTTRTTPNKTSCFEYKSVVTAAQLLEEERQRVVVVSQDRSAADREAKRVAEAALTLAQTQLSELQASLTQSQGDLTAARNEARRWREEADLATKRANDLQTSIDGLQGNINTLTNQLALTTSPEAAAILQAQLADLTSQLSTAQTLQAQAIAQANAAQVAASQTTVAANQAEVVVAQTQTVVDTVAAQVSELSPWYIRYKWFLVGGAVLAVGAYWYMNKQKTAAAPVLAKNGLPVPTSARRPSGLNRNRRHGR